MKNIVFIILALFGSTVGLKAQATLEASDPTIQSQLNEVLSKYYALKDDLVKDDTRGAKATAADLATALKNVNLQIFASTQVFFYQPYHEKMVADVEIIKSAKDIEAMREAFKTLSANLWEVVKKFKPNNGTPAYLAYCPMAKASWISKSTAIKNPYYGNKMLTCGKVTETVK